MINPFYRWSVHRLLSALCIAASIASGGVAAHPARQQPDGAEIRFQKEFDLVCKDVREHFYDVKLHGLDWKQVQERYQAKLGAVTSKEAFAALINQVLGELKASHTEYYTDDEQEFYMLPSVMQGDLKERRVAHIGIMGHKSADGYLVTGVMEGGPADKAGIQRGDYILTAGGAPFTTVGSFRGKEGESVELSVRQGKTGATRQVSVKPVRQNLLRSFLDATDASVRTLQFGGKRIGYLHLWTMGHPAFREALERIVTERLHNTDGLILDLRDGFGGYPWGYSDVFYRPDLTVLQSGRENRDVSRHLGYSKPVVLVINSGTRSAKELLSYQMKQSGRAVLVGSRTAGAVLGAGSYPIGSDGLLELAIVGMKVDNRSLEGVGVSPDIAVVENPYGPDEEQVRTAEQTVLGLIQQKEKADSVRRVPVY